MMGDEWVREKGRKTLLAVFDFLKLNKERKERFFGRAESTKFKIQDPFQIEEQALN